MRYCRASKRLISSLVCMGVGASSLLSCSQPSLQNEKNSELHSQVGSPIPVSISSDSDLFLSNVDVPHGLQQEVKNQFLAAVNLYKKAFAEVDMDGELALTEVNIVKTGSEKLAVSVDLSGKVTTKATPPEGEAPLQLEANTLYEVERSKYNIQFTFLDKKGILGAGSEYSEVIRVYRIGLEDLNGLEVYENLHIKSLAKLSLNALSGLPNWLSQLVAQFFMDINISLSQNTDWSRSSELSPSMYYRGKGNKTTEFTRLLAKDVVKRLCLMANEARGGGGASCEITLPESANALAELQEDLKLQTAMPILNGCKKTSLVENGVPLYQFYFIVPKGANVFLRNSKAYLYQKEDGGWSRWKENRFSKWFTVEGTADLSSCKGATENDVCLRGYYGSFFFDSTCQQISSGSLTLGVSDLNQKNILN
jgi:hypothetical protein